MNGFSFFVCGLRGLIKQYYGRRARNKDFYAEELIRNTHSIEKGLCIENPRKDFGHAKLSEMKRLIGLLSDSNDVLHKTAVGMAKGAIQEYFSCQGSAEHRDEFSASFDSLIGDNLGADKMGGTISVSKRNLVFDIEGIEQFFLSRHSIRDYSEEDVDDSVLLKALRLAQQAPSACNRQGVRAYIVGKDHIKDLTNQLSEIGGFAKAAKRIIIITGKMSAYRPEEINQYIVSASIYSAYLSLTLHLYGLASCIIQRPVVWTNFWELNRVKFGINPDEQIICLLTVGNMKDSFKVPVSYRIKDCYKFL